MLVPLGILLILLGIILLTIGVLFSGGKVYFGVGGFIGPIPFGFANDPRMLLLIIFLTLLTVILFLVWRFMI